MLVTTVLGYCMAAAGLLVILFLVLLQNLLGNQKLLDPLIKLVCRVLPLGFGCRVRVTGRARIDPGKPYIFMSNHVNIFDPVIIYGHVPNFLRAVELESHFSWPVWGTITRRLGNIPISHSHMARALESLQKAAELMRRGTSIAILPEGHRTRDGRLGAFMRGPFRLALNVEADIVPMALKGGFDRKSVHSPLVRPGRMELAIGRPISFQTVATQTERELRSTVRAAIQTLLE